MNFVVLLVIFGYIVIVVVNIFVMVIGEWLWEFVLL